jgi:hypothetical protein
MPMAGETVFECLARQDILLREVIDAPSLADSLVETGDDGETPTLNKKGTIKDCHSVHVSAKGIQSCCYVHECLDMATMLRRGHKHFGSCWNKEGVLLSNGGKVEHNLLQV